MSEDVKGWLNEHGLGEYAHAFIENDIRIADLPLLTEEDLREMGLPIGPRRRFLASAKSAPGRGETKSAVNEPATDSPSTLSEAERRQLTVMFCDLARSTELSRKTDPEEMREVNRAFESACEAGIERYDGFLARYMGDGVLAYFGYPTAHEDDAERAIRAALEVAKSVPGISTESLVALGVSPAVRVGIDTGPVVVEVIGEGASQESAISGDAPNLAKRLQGLADENTVVIGPGTHALAGEQFECESLGTHSLKGFDEPVQAWRVTAPAALESRFEARRGVGLTSLVGREHEIALMLDRWSQAKEGDGQVILLSGEAGIGKSRVTEALHERTDKDGPVRLRYQCSPYYANTALHPVIEQLEREAQFDTDDTNEGKLDKLEAMIGEALSDTKVLARLLAPLLSLPTGDRYPALQMTSERQKEETLEALVSQVDGLSRQQPVLVIFEDIHWADPTSLELLELTIERAQNIPALVVLTYRPEFSPPWSGYTHITSLALNRFSRSLASAMVENVTGGKALPAKVVEQIIKKTDGVPLFVEELTKTILESGQLQEEDGRFVATGTLQDVTIPATLHDSLMARLDRLGAVKEVAQTAAAIGREFEYDLLSVVSSLSFEKLHDALGQLVDAELAYRRGRSEAGGYMFKHALVQDAAYGSLLRSRRQDLHGRIALGLRDRFPERVESEPELLAHHLTEAALIEPAIEQWKQAGLRALGTSAYAETVSHMKKALGLFRQLEDSTERPQEELSLQHPLAVALTAVGGLTAPETGEAVSRARELCQQVSDSSQTYPVLYGMWNYRLGIGHLREATELAEELLELAERDGERSRKLAANVALGQTLTLVGRLNVAQAHLEKSIALHHPGEDKTLAQIYGEDPVSFAQGFRSWVLWFRGFPEQALSQSHEAVHTAQQGSDITVGPALALAAALRYHRRDGKAAGESAEEALHFNTEWDIPFFRIYSALLKGRSLVNGDHPEDGIAMMESAVAEWKAIEALVSLSFLLILFAEGHHRCGNFDEALKLLDESSQQAERNGEYIWESEAYRLRGEVLRTGSQEGIQEVESCYQQAIQTAREQDAKSFELRACTSLARLWCDQSKHNEARDLLVSIYDWFTEGFDTPDLQEAKALLDELS